MPSHIRTWLTWLMSFIVFVFILLLVAVGFSGLWNSLILIKR